MVAMIEPTRGFPCIRIPSHRGGLPVEVALIAQLGPGGGNMLHAHASRNQQGHDSFIDALDEPSAKVFGVDFTHDDATSLYSFSVGSNGHPFHRHAGHRVFTAISGSGGAQLRFSTVPDSALHADPAAFTASLHHVNIPADSLFVVRFGGETWHQFAPLQPDSRHPALFALSCHTDELSGIRDPDLAQAICDNTANIPSLTELLPAPVLAHLARHPIDAACVTTTSLSFHAEPGSLALKACTWLRRASGRLRQMLARLHPTAGFVGTSLRQRARCSDDIGGHVLLLQQFRQARIHHEDKVLLTLPVSETPTSCSMQFMERVLDGFIHNRPQGVSWLMRVRNLLVGPLGLRTSPLGCPVASLATDGGDSPRFAGRFPVIDQHISPDGRHVEVLLGADDRHLRFRSSVCVQREGNDYRVSLATRVTCRNIFGRIYMAMIERIHRTYIAPRLLDMAIAHAMQRQADTTEPRHAERAMPGPPR